MKVRFIVLEPESKRGTYEVPLPIVVGRGNEARFRIQQDRISRKHCELFDRDGDVYVRDLGSTNGTFLDGEQIAASLRTPVPPGSVLRVGTIEIRIDYEGSGRLAPVEASAATVPEDAMIGFTPIEASEPEEAFPSFGESEPTEAPHLDFDRAARSKVPAEAPEEEVVAGAANAVQVTEAPPAVEIAAVVETQKAPEPGDFGAIDAEEPVIEAFDADAFGGATAEAEQPADGSFDFLGGSKEEQPADDADLGDFFKGLK